MASIFTQIIEGKIPADFVYQDQDCIAIHDIRPQAKTHILIIPKKEIPTINDLQEEDSLGIGKLFLVAKYIAKTLGIEDGYQLKFHVGEKGGQEVMHIHLHLLSDL